MKTNHTLAPLLVQPTEKTPSINFVHERNYFSMRGNACTSKAKDLFVNAVQWLNEYEAFLDHRILSDKMFAGQIHLVFEINLQQTDAFGKEGIKLLLWKIALMRSRYVQVKVRWHYDSENENKKSFLKQCIDSCAVFFEPVNERGVPSLFICPTDTTPGVFFDSINRTFRISGSSLPEYCAVFYHTIIQWVEEHGKKYMQGVPLDIRMRYFNSSSAKQIMQLLKRIDKLYSQDDMGVINWDYEIPEEREEVQDEFEINSTNLYFNYVQQRLITGAKEYVSSVLSRQ